MGTISPMSFELWKALRVLVLVVPFSFSEIITARKIDLFS